MRGLERPRLALSGDCCSRHVTDAEEPRLRLLSLRRYDLVLDLLAPLTSMVSRTWAAGLLNSVRQAVKTRRFWTVSLPYRTLQVLPPIPPYSSLS